LDPRGERIVLLEVGTDEKLVSNVEDLDDLVQNGERDFALWHCHVLFDNLTESPAALLHDVENGSPLLVQLVLKLLGEAEEGHAPSQDAFVIARL